MAQWIQVVIGVWVMLAPWLLGWSGISLMMWSSLLSGLAIVLLNLWTLFGKGEQK